MNTQRTLSIGNGVAVPDFIDEWLKQFLGDAEAETEVLRRNGAHHHAEARNALIRGLVAAAEKWGDQIVTTDEAAKHLGVCAETVRRAVGRGQLSSTKASSRGRHHISNRALASFEKGRYDAVADAQDIAKLRRGS